MRISDWSSDVCSSDLSTAGSGWSGSCAGTVRTRSGAGTSSISPRAPSPAKAGEGWGGVPFGSVRAVGTPSLPPPAFAGGGVMSCVRRLFPQRALVQVQRVARVLGRLRVTGDHDDVLAVFAVAHPHPPPPH